MQHATTCNTSSQPATRYNSKPDMLVLRPSNAMQSNNAARTLMEGELHAVNTRVAKTICKTRTPSQLLLGGPACGNLAAKGTEIRRSTSAKHAVSKNTKHPQPMHHLLWQSRSITHHGSVAQHIYTSYSKNNSCNIARKTAQ
jgi:hypothetical protein